MTGTNIGNIYATVGADTKQFERAMESVKRESAAVERTLTSLGSVAMSGLTMAAQAAVAATAALAAGFVTLSIKATTMSAEFEQTKIAFSTMLGSASEANRFLKEMEDFAARTPFTFPELVTSARMMKAFGFETAQVIPMMKNIGDASAGLGAGEYGISRIVRALGQMKAKTKVSAEEMMQLTEVGVNGWQYISDAAGKSVRIVQQEAEKGIITADFAIKAILKGFERDFGGMMDAQSQTMLGLWSTLKDNIGFALRDMGDVLLGPVKRLVEVIGKEFTKLRENQTIKNLFRDLGQDALLFLPTVIELLGMMAKEFMAIAWAVRGVRVFFREGELERQKNLLSTMKAQQAAPKHIQERMTPLAPGAIEKQAAEVARLELELGALNKAQENVVSTWTDWDDRIKKVSDSFQESIALQLKIQSGALRGGEDVLSEADFMGGYSSSKAAGKPEVDPGLTIAQQKELDKRYAVAKNHAEDIERIDTQMWKDGLAKREALHQKDLQLAAEITAVDVALHQEKLARESAYYRNLEEIRARAYQTQIEEMYAADLVIEEQKALELAREDAYQKKKWEMAVAHANQARDLIAEIGTGMIATAKSAYQSMTTGIGNAFAQMLVYGQSLEKGLSDLWRSIAATVVQSLIAIMVQAMITYAALQLLGLGTLTGGGFGGAIGKVLNFHGGIDYVPTSGLATAAAHGGMTSVPLETTFTLQKGERVLSPRQNEDFTRFMKDGNKGGGNQPIVLQVDGATLAKVVTRNANLGGGRSGRYNLTVAGS